MGGCTRRVQTAWLSLGSALEMPWLALGGPLLYEQVEKAVLLPCTAPISVREDFFPVWVSSCQLSAMTIASSIMGGCGLSHEHVEDGCKSTCEVWVWGLKTLYRTGSLMHV